MIEIKGKYALIINSLFQSLLISYLILLLIDNVFDIVSFYFNLNYLLIVVIIFGILLALTKKEQIKEESIKKKDYYYITLLSIIGIIIIFIRTKQLGWLGYLISIILGMFIFLLNYLVSIKNEKYLKF